MTRKTIKKIEFNNLTLKTSNGGALFNDITFAFPMNSVVWVRGESGSGKSVIAKILGGLVSPTYGSYKINDEEINEMSFEEFLPYRCNMGYGFDFGGLINDRDILNNLLLPVQYHNYGLGTGDELISEVNKYLKLFGLEQIAHERPSAIVGRLRKAACVARAFVHNPNLIILDDPTTGLRSETSQALQKLILEKLKNSNLQHVFIVTEDESFMSKFDAKIIEIKQNKIHLKEGRKVA